MINSPSNVEGNESLPSGCSIPQAQPFSEQQQQWEQWQQQQLRTQYIPNEQQSYTNYYQSNGYSSGLTAPSQTGHSHSLANPTMQYSFPTFQSTSNTVVTSSPPMIDLLESGGSAAVPRSLLDNNHRSSSYQNDLDKQQLPQASYYRNYSHYSQQSMKSGYPASTDQLGRTDQQCNQVNYNPTVSSIGHNMSANIAGQKLYNSPQSISHNNIKTQESSYILENKMHDLILNESDQQLMEELPPETQMHLHQWPSHIQDHRPLTSHSSETPFLPPVATQYQPSNIYPSHSSHFNPHSTVSSPQMLATTQQQYARAPEVNFAPPNQQYRQGATPPNFRQTDVDLFSTHGNLLLPETKDVVQEVDWPTPKVKARNNVIPVEPEIVSCSLNAIPTTNQLLEKSRLPLGLVVHPYRDLSALSVITPSVIVRCRTCRTYINPFVIAPEVGPSATRRWKCNVCSRVNDLPDEFEVSSASKGYGEFRQRPELRYSTVEYVAPNEYTIRSPQVAVYLFLMEVSEVALASDYLSLVCDSITECIDHIPGNSMALIGFITFSSIMEFYNLAGPSPRMLACPDLEEPYLPDNQGLLVPIRTGRRTILDLLEALPNIHSSNASAKQSAQSASDNGNCLGSALKVSLQLMGNTGGRITVFLHSLPNKGLGQLPDRSVSSAKSKRREELLGPSTDFYKRLALDCAGRQVGVDMFALGTAYKDLATVSGVVRHCGGGLYHYPHIGPEPSADCFQQNANSTYHTTMLGRKVAQFRLLDLRRFRQDLQRYLTRKVGFEAVMRLRCTTGLSIVAFHGNSFVRSTDLISLPNVNPDTGFVIQLAIDSSSLCEQTQVCLQVALLYTTSLAERRIRVHTLCLPVTGLVSEVVKWANPWAVGALLSRLAATRALQESGEGGLQGAKEALVHSLADVISSYHDASGVTSLSHQGMLRLPYNLRLLPMLILGIFKCPGLATGSGDPNSSVGIALDMQTVSLSKMQNLPLTQLWPFLIPVIYALHEVVDSEPIPWQSERDRMADVAQQEYYKGEIDEGDEDEEEDYLQIDKTTGEMSSSSSTPSSTRRIASSDPIFPNNRFPGLRRVPPGAAYLSREGLYLIDTGGCLLLYIPRNFSGSACQKLFGVATSSSLSLPTNSRDRVLPGGNATDYNNDEDGSGGRRENLLSCRIKSFVSILQSRRKTGTALCLLRDPPHDLSLLIRRLILDRTNDKQCSYGEFLQTVADIVRGG